MDDSGHWEAYVGAPGVAVAASICRDRASCQYFLNPNA